MARAGDEAVAVGGSRAPTVAREAWLAGAARPDGVAPERGLAERIAAGDRAAEAEAFRRYHRLVIAVARGGGGDRSHAEDVAQETFRVAIERLRAGLLRDPGALVPFLAGLARRLSGTVRRQRRWRASQPWLDVAAASHGGWSRSPLDELLAGERRSQARQLLEALPQGRDRDVLRCIYLEDVERTAVCRGLGLTPSQLNRVLVRARERLRERWMSASVEG